MSPTKLILVTIVCYGISSFCRKLSIQSITPVLDQVIAAIVYTLAIPIYFNLLNVQISTLQYDVKGVTYSIIASLVAQIGSLAFIYAADKQSIGSLTGMIGIYPIVTIILSIVLLGEQFSNQKLVGISLAIIGILLIQK